MKRPEEIKIEFTREWIKKAESDLAAAEHLNEGGEGKKAKGKRQKAKGKRQKAKGKR